MPKRGQKQAYRVIYRSQGKDSRVACSDDGQAYATARTAAHARRNEETEEDRIVRVLYVHPETGEEVELDRLEGDQGEDDDEE